MEKWLIDASHHDNSHLFLYYFAEFPNLPLRRSNILSPSKDLILLDEPTNHVDLETVEFMEHLLRQQEVAMVVVSHDRYFLNQVCNLSMNGCCNFFRWWGLNDFE